MRFKITLALTVALIALGLRSLTPPRTLPESSPELDAVDMILPMPVLAEAPPN